MTTLPIWRCQRRIAWAGVLPCRSAIAAIVSSSSSSPWASGLQASVAIRGSACQARSSACWKRGCSSTWLTVGRVSGLGLQPLEVLDAEVGDADRARAPFLVDAFEGTPGVDEAVFARHRPVDQVEVDVVEAEAAETGLEGRQSRVVTLLGVPELGRDEDVLAGDARGRDRGADALLVAVGPGGVDVAVAGIERLFDHLLRVLGRHLEDAEPELGDLRRHREG